MSEAVAGNTPVPAQEVAQSTVNGVRVLALRSLLLRAVGLVSGILLARWLSPDMFGLFAVCNFVVQSLRVVSDGGLAAALIQQPAEPDEADYRSAFTLQLTAAALLSLGLWIAGPALSAAYRMGEAGAALLAALSLSMLVSALTTVPAVALDRSLRFGCRALADLAQQSTYYAVAVLLAWKGWGVWALVWGTVLGAFADAAVLNRFHRWRVRPAWDRPRMRTLLHRGLPIQGQSLLFLLEECLLPLGLGALCGPLGLGYAVWARSLSLIPHGVVHSIAGRLALPSLSRLQDQPETLARYLDRAVEGIAFVVLPCFAGLAGLAWWFVPTVFSSKWVPALPSLYWFLCGAAVATVATPYSLALTAVGKARNGLRVRLVTLGLMWTLGALVSWIYGPAGYAAASFAGVLLAAHLTQRELQAGLPTRLARALLAPLTASLPVLLALLLLPRGLFSNFFALAGVLTLIGLGYLALVRLTLRLGLAGLDPFALAFRIAKFGPGKVSPL